MFGNYPPGIETPLFYMGAVFAYLLGFILALEWLWRIAWAFVEQPAPHKSPATAVRLITGCLLLVMVVFVGPRLWLFLRWQQLDLAERLNLAEMSAQFTIAGVVLFSVGWLLSYLGEPMIRYQLVKEPLPLHLWPSKEQAKRPLKIGSAVLALAFAIAYLG